MFNFSHALIESCLKHIYALGHTCSTVDFQHGIANDFVFDDGIMLRHIGLRIINKHRFFLGLIRVLVE